MGKNGDFRSEMTLRGSMCVRQIDVEYAVMMKMPQVEIAVARLYECITISGTTDLVNLHITNHVTRGCSGV